MVRWPHAKSREAMKSARPGLPVGFNLPYVRVNCGGQMRRELRVQARALMIVGGLLHRDIGAAERRAVRLGIRRVPTGRDENIWTVSRGYAALHPGLVSFRPSGTGAVRYGTQAFFRML